MGLLIWSRNHLGGEHLQELSQDLLHLANVNVNAGAAVMGGSELLRAECTRLASLLQHASLRSTGRQQDKLDLIRSLVSLVEVTTDRWEDGPGAEDEEDDGGQKRSQDLENLRDVLRDVGESSSHGESQSVCASPTNRPDSERLGGELMIRGDCALLNGDDLVEGADHARKIDGNLASADRDDNYESTVCNEIASDCDKMRALLHTKSSTSTSYNSWRRSIASQMQRTHEKLIAEVAPDEMHHANSTDECPNLLGEVRHLRNEREALREENSKLMQKIRTLSLFSSRNTHLHRNRVASNCSLSTTNSLSSPSCTSTTNSSASGFTSNASRPDTPLVEPSGDIYLGGRRYGLEQDESTFNCHDLEEHLPAERTRSCPDSPKSKLPTNHFQLDSTPCRKGVAHF